MMGDGHYVYNAVAKTESKDGDVSEDDLGFFLLQ
jgi:hypothetical protein